MFRGIRAIGSITAAVLLAGFVAAEPRPVEPSTWLTHCGGATCLMITGHRRDPAAPILVAGHRVMAQGGRTWRVAVPLSTIGEWSAPAARSISVEVAGQGGNVAQAVLPIGLLGHVTELALLDVSAPH